MKLLKLLLVSTPLLLTVSANASSWESIKFPVAGKMQSVGSYANGKNRFYGHSKLVSFIQRLGKNAQNSGLPTLLIGDMGMPAGGRFSSGHASHQTGLDSDIWLRFGPLSDKQAEKPTATVMVSGDYVNSNWTSHQADLIRLAATDPNVARIFVNPAIKVKLCQTAKGDRSWLRKVRPWFGHTAHMHVRLNCPKDSKKQEKGVVQLYILGLSQENHQKNLKKSKQDLCHQLCVKQSFQIKV